MGPMVDLMRARKTKKLSKERLDILDIIRANYRNPTSHPEKEYDLDEVQDLFVLSLDAINKLLNSTM
jgi:hypothetical protein